MIMRVIRVFFVMFFLMINAVMFGQDPQFSQFYAAPLYMAPSFAGASEKTRFTLNYRDQWPKISGTFVTYLFGADHYFDKFNSGVGIYFMSDRAGKGKISTTNLAGNYSYKLKLNNRWYFQPGLKFYYHQYLLDYSKVVFPDQLGFDYISPTTVDRNGSERVSYFDFGSSVLFYNGKYWIGAMVDHLLKAYPSFLDNPNYKPMQYTVFGGAKIPLGNTRFRRNRSNLYAAMNFVSQQQVKQLELGAYYEKNSFLVGLWYRGIPVLHGNTLGDALILLLGYKSNGFNIGYSYDFTISPLITKTGGAHEISLRYSFSADDLLGREYTPLPCPDF